MGKDFGGWLRERIADQPSTIHAFAQTVGITEATLHRWLRNDTQKFRADLVTRLATALGLSRAELLKKLPNQSSAAVRNPRSTRSSEIGALPKPTSSNPALSVPDQSAGH